MPRFPKSKCFYCEKFHYGLYSGEGYCCSSCGKYFRWLDSWIKAWAEIGWHAKVDLQIKYMKNKTTTCYYGF